MRRLRVPTIPNMGMFLSQGEGEPLEACDSAIFADAEEESPRPEKRPSAPRFSGLRRRPTNQEQRRFMDASQNENHVEKRPTATMRFKAFKSLSFGKQVHTSDLKENQDESEVTIIQDFKTKPCDSKNPLENETECSRQISQHQTDQMNDASRTEDTSSKGADVGIAKAVSLATKLRQVEVLKPFRKVAESVTALQRHLAQHSVPRLQERTRLGFAIVVTNFTLVINFLTWCLEYVSNLFAAFKIERILGVTETDETPVLASITKDSSSTSHTNTLSRATDAEECVGEQLCSDKTNLSTDISPIEIDSLQNSGEKHGSASSLKSTRLSSDLRLDPCAAGTTQTKNFGTLSSDMTEEMMTAVPRIPSFNRTSNYPLKEDNTAQKEETKASASHHERRDSASKIESQSITDDGPHRRFSANVVNNGSSTDTLSQDRNSADDLMNELDGNSMRFEHKESEIIISPLANPTSPTFLSDGEFNRDNGHVMKHLNGDNRIPKQPVRHSTEMQDLGRFPGKKRNPRGPTGKLKTDVRTMKDSIFRIFGRNKSEPETRFASPRSARKTLTLIADVLVKEHGCDVAVRKNGALKMRCEKIFTGNQRLKVRLAFQPMDAYSCNVTICRSREDDLQISTTDYVNFVADVQRSFLNATSEGMLGTRDGN